MVGDVEMEARVIAWVVSGVSEEVPNAANGAEAEVKRNADKARESKFWGLADVHHQASMDHRKDPDLQFRTDKRGE